MLSMFVFMLGHMLMPHHHHADHLEAGLMQKHVGEGDHPDHHHHTIDPFFSLLSYFNDVEQFDFSVDDADFQFLGMLAIVFSEFGLIEDDSRVGTDPPPPVLLLAEGLSKSHGLRAPPLM